jgi:hypothetical protein
MDGMADDFHKPVFFSGQAFAAFQGGEDPATINPGSPTRRPAHCSAGCATIRSPR